MEKLSVPPTREKRNRALPIILFALSALLLLFLTYLGDVDEFVKTVFNSTTAGGPPDMMPGKAPLPFVNPFTAIMQILVTVLVGSTAVFVILAKRYGPKDKHWAYATLGTVLGYWLKG